MRGNGTLCSLLLLFGGCSTASDGAGAGSGSGSGRVIKVTYFRFQEGKDQSLPMYFVLLSESWCRDRGPTPGEPMARTRESSR